LKIKFRYIILFIFLAPKSIFSCSCINNSLSINHINSTEVIFKGKVIGAEEILLKGELRQTKYTFKIDELIKGNHQEENIIIYTNLSSAACGSSFSMHQEYYIFSNKENNRFNTNLCSHNQPFEKDSFTTKLINKYKEEKNTKWYNSDGILIAEGKIKHGTPEGFWVISNDNGDIIEEGNFKNGLKHGEWTIYRSELYSHINFDKPIKENYFEGKKRKNK